MYIKQHFTTLRMHTLLFFNGVGGGGGFKNKYSWNVTFKIITHSSSFIHIFQNRAKFTRTCVNILFKSKILAEK